MSTQYRVQFDGSDLAELVAGGSGILVPVIAPGEAAAEKYVGQGVDYNAIRRAITYDGTWSVFGPDCLNLLAERAEDEDGSITREPLTMWVGGKKYPIEHIES